MRIRQSIECWITNSDKEVLLLTVEETLRHPKFNQPITGGIEAEETPEVACVREIFEETGLETTQDQLITVKKDFYVQIDEKFAVNKAIFILRTEKFKPKLNPKEHIWFKWAEFSEVEAKLFYKSNIETWNLIKEHI